MKLKIELLFLIVFAMNGCEACDLPPKPISDAPSDSDKLPSRDYQALKERVKVHPGHNQDPTFVGIQGMKDALRSQPIGYGDLTKFKSWAQAGEWKKFHDYHYDWWIFPIDRSSGQGLKYTVYQQDIQQLKADSTWLQDYRLGAILLMQSWGWDVVNEKMFDSLTPDQQWQNWGVRLGKLGHSLILFEQWDLYAGVAAYVQYLTKSGVKLEKWVLSYFPTDRS